MNGYTKFAHCYDKLMSNVDYERLADKFIALSIKHSQEPKLILDAACGTGSFTLQLFNKGFDVIGVDASDEMLSIAKQKLNNDKALFIRQDLSELDLYGTVDSTFCTLDSLNHITDKNKIKKVFKKISLFTKPGGLFIFDVNTVFKHKVILSNNTFVIDEEDIYLVWQNQQCANNVVNINLDFFINIGESYLRESENFFERAYTDNEIVGFCENSGFEVLERIDFDTFKKPSLKSEKIIYVAKKVG